jgi:hypothetical protein
MLGYLGALLPFAFLFSPSLFALTCLKEPYLTILLQMQVSVVQDLVTNYFEVVRKRVRDSVPKAVRDIACKPIAYMLIYMVFA